MTYTLHYAPDNASLIIRLALEHRALPYQTVLVNRATAEQSKPTFRALNPNGLIPVLETPHGPMFETGAILLWLADTHGGLAPAADDPARGTFLKWLFFVANTLHPSLRMMFYPGKYIAAEQASALRLGLGAQLHQGFKTLNAAAADLTPKSGTEATALDFYICALLRWSALYPQDGHTGWFDLAAYPALADICHRVEALPGTTRLHITEGLGTQPFSNPHPADPPEGSAL